MRHDEHAEDRRDGEGEGATAQSMVLVPMRPASAIAGWCAVDGSEVPMASGHRQSEHECQGGDDDESAADAEQSGEEPDHGPARNTFATVPR